MEEGGIGGMLWVWAFVFVLALGLDLLTFTLVGAALAAGALITFAASAAGLGRWASILCFVLMGGLSLALLRPYLLRVLMRSPALPPLGERRSTAGSHAIAETRITDAGGVIRTREVLPWTAADGPQVGRDGPADPGGVPPETVWSARSFPPGSVLSPGTPVEILYRDGGDLVVRAMDPAPDRRGAHR